MSAFTPRRPEGAAERIRLLQFVTVFAVGGTERHVMTLSRRLDASRFHLHFGCFKRGGEFLDEVEATGQPLADYAIGTLPSRKTLAQQVRFVHDLRRDRMQIVHTYGFHANVFGIPAARLARVPAVVASIRDTGDHLSPAQRRVQRLACRFAHRILVNADAVKQRLVAEGYGAERITVIRNGIRVPAFRRPRTDGRLHRALGFPSGAVIVTALSRLVGLKGLEYFIHAAGRLAPRFPDARFLIVGSGQAVQDGAVVDSPYKRELEARAARLGLADRVVFTGFRPDVPELLAETAVSVLPSLSEGLSNAILESMAAGVAVVATRVGGTPEAVQDGVTGLLVPPRDSDALARAIGSLLGDGALRARMGAAARRRVEDLFSDERMVRDTEQCYLALLERRVAPRPSPQEGRA